MKITTIFLLRNYSSRHYYSRINNSNHNNSLQKTKIIKPNMNLKRKTIFKAISNKIPSRIEQISMAYPKKNIC